MLFNGVVWIFVDGFVWICMLFFDFCGCVLLLLFNGFFFNEYMLMIFRSFLVGPPHLLFEFEILAQNHVRFLSSHFVGESSFNISLLCCSDTSRSQCVFTCSQETFLDWFTRSTTDPNLHLGLFKVSCKSTTVVWQIEDSVVLLMVLPSKSGGYGNGYISWWFQPEKHARQIGSISPFFRAEHKRYVKPPRWEFNLYCSIWCFTGLLPSTVSLATCQNRSKPETDSMDRLKASLGLYKILEK